MADTRCATCEDEFMSGYLRAKTRAAVAGGVLALLLLAVLGVSGVAGKLFAIPYAGVGLGLGSAGVVSAAIWITRTRLRRRFLAETASPARPAYDAGGRTAAAA